MWKYEVHQSQSKSWGFSYTQEASLLLATLALCVGMCLCMEACLPVCVHAEARGPCWVSFSLRLHRFRQDRSPVLELADLARLAGE